MKKGLYSGFLIGIICCGFICQVAFAFDFGDAPDMREFSPDVHCGYPTLDASDGAYHIDTARAWLGRMITDEFEAKLNDQDEDDGLTGRDKVLIHNEAWDGPLYLNVLFDTNSTGEIDCDPGYGLWDSPSEWVVRNVEINIAPGEDAVVTIPPVPDNTWVRITLTGRPIDHYTGRGEYEIGETEDYFLTVGQMSNETESTIVPPPEDSEQGPPPVCGNGVLEGNEQCDPPILCGAGLVCVNCQCVLPPWSVCGNGIVDPGETCDPPGSECGHGSVCDSNCRCVPKDTVSEDNGTGQSSYDPEKLPDRIITTSGLCRMPGMDFTDSDCDQCKKYILSQIYAELCRKDGTEGTIVELKNKLVGKARELNEIYEEYQRIKQKIQAGAANEKYAENLSDIKQRWHEKKKELGYDNLKKRIDALVKQWEQKKQDLMRQALEEAKQRCIEVCGDCCETIFFKIKKLDGLYSKISARLDQYRFAMDNAYGELQMYDYYLMKILKNTLDDRKQFDIVNSAGNALFGLLLSSATNPGNISKLTELIHEKTTFREFVAKLVGPGGVGGAISSADLTLITTEFPALLDELMSKGDGNDDLSSLLHQKMKRHLKYLIEGLNRANDFSVAINDARKAIRELAECFKCELASESQLNEPGPDSNDPDSESNAHIRRIARQNTAYVQEGLRNCDFCEALLRAYKGLQYYEYVLNRLKDNYALLDNAYLDRKRRTADLLKFLAQDTWRGMLSDVLLSAIAGLGGPVTSLVKDAAVAIVDYIEDEKVRDPVIKDHKKAIKDMTERIDNYYENIHKWRSEIMPLLKYSNEPLNAFRFNDCESPCDSVNDGISEASSSDRITLSLYVDNPVVKKGEKLTLSLSAVYDGPPMSVDIHFGMVTPEGEILEFPDWNPYFRPMVSAFVLPSDLYMNRANFMTFEVSSDELPLSGSGEYSFVLVCTKPGTFDLVSEIADVQFVYAGDLDEEKISALTHDEHSNSTAMGPGTDQKSSSCDGRCSHEEATDALSVCFVEDCLAGTLYNADSPFNNRIPTAPEIDPNSDLMIKHMLEAGDLVLMVKQYTATVFFATEDTPRNDVYLTCGASWGLGVDYLLNVPVPRGAFPSYDVDGADSQSLEACGVHSDQDNFMVIIDPHQGCEYDLWQARKENGQWVASWAVASPMDSNGVFDGGLSARGSGFAFLGGVIWPHELERGHIDHALAFNYPFTRAGGPVPPATESDGIIEAEWAIPLGARLQLDPDLDLNSLGLTHYEMTIAKAMQEYGLVLVDTGGDSGIGLYAVHPKSFASNPYENILPDEDFVVMSKIPVTKLRVLKMSAPISDWEDRSRLPDNYCVMYEEK